MYGDVCHAVGRKAEALSKVRGDGKCFWGGRRVETYGYRCAFQKTDLALGAGVVKEPLCILTSGDVGWSWRLLCKSLFPEAMCVFHIMQ